MTMTTVQVLVTVMVRPPALVRGAERVSTLSLCLLVTIIRPGAAREMSAVWVSDI